MKRFKNFAISMLILALLLTLGYGYYRYIDYYYGQQFYKECSLSSEKDAYSFKKNAPLSVPVSVKNQSRTALTSSNNYFLSYRLLDENGTVIDPNGGERTPVDIDPFRTDSVALGFQVPNPGAYQLVIDVVRDGYYWYGDLGGTTLTVKVTVE